MKFLTTFLLAGALSFFAGHLPGQELGVSPAQPPPATQKPGLQTSQSPAQPQVPTSPAGAPGNQPTNFWTQDTATGTWGRVSR